MSREIAQYATTVVRTKNSWNKGGTGFLLSKVAPDRSERLYLVTNKHTIGDSQDQRKEIEWLAIDCHAITGGRQYTKATLTIDFQGLIARGLFHQHPDPQVDVAAVDVTEIATDREVQFLTNKISAKMLATREIRDIYEVSVGDDVLVIGYPALEPNIEYARVHLPFVKQGMLASHIGQQLLLRRDGNSKTERRRSFLVDGIVVPGLSGSPVLLKPNVRWRSAKNTPPGHNTHSVPPILLGILSDTTFAAAKQKSPRMDVDVFAGFALACDAETIAEAINLSEK